MGEWIANGRRRIEHGLSHLTNYEGVIWHVTGLTQKFEQGYSWRQGLVHFGSVGSVVNQQPENHSRLRWTYYR